MKNARTRSINCLCRLSIGLFIPCLYSAFISNCRLCIVMFHSQGVLVRFSESIKSHLDNNNVTAAVLTDLSKAFDCLPYDLLLSKFYHYGLDESACKLVANYFMDRYHRVKLGCVKSDWLKLSKGAPQGICYRTVCL